jgi:hypothetical protein
LKKGLTALIVIFHWMPSFPRITPGQMAIGLRSGSSVQNAGNPFNNPLSAMPFEPEEPTREIRKVLDDA